jgi:hypothetical protein
MTEPDLKEVIGPDLSDFNHWMRGQTMSICDGRSYNHEAGQYEPTECADTPHGIVAYPWDVERYLHGYPVIDLCHASFTGTRSSAGSIPARPSGTGAAAVSSQTT